MNSERGRNSDDRNVVEAEGFDLHGRRGLSAAPVRAQGNTGGRIQDELTWPQQIVDWLISSIFCFNAVRRGNRPIVAKERGGTRRATRTGKASRPNLPAWRY
jgi:hypothetical protein